VTLHKNARTRPASRLLLARRVCHEGWSLKAAAAAAGISDVAARRWIRRYRGGDHELADRSSAPRRIPAKTSPEREQAICSLRELRLTAAQIAEVLGMAHSTVSAVLKRHGLGRLPRAIDEPDNRYERPLPGELGHVDVKKLGAFDAIGHHMSGDRAQRSRGAGWEFVHVFVDDCTRMAYVEVLVDERATTVCGFLERAVGAPIGVAPQRMPAPAAAAVDDLQMPRRAHAAAHRGRSSRAAALCSQLCSQIVRDNPRQGSSDVGTSPYSSKLGHPETSLQAGGRRFDPGWLHAREDRPSAAEWIATAKESRAPLLIPGERSGGRPGSTLEARVSWTLRARLGAPV
jgi:transposase